jgi:DNA invertase Pin-like site-specific DNA recombinase
LVLVQELLNQGVGVAEIAKTAGLARQTVYRIQKKLERQAAALSVWYPNSEGVTV